MSGMDVVWSACQGNSIRWVHLTGSELTAATIVDFSEGLLTTMESPPDLDLYQTPSSTLVVDGLTAETKIIAAAALGWWRQDRQRRRVLLVSSMQYSVGMEDNRAHNLTPLSSHGWSIREYKQACKDPSFYHSVRPNLDTNDTATSVEEEISSKFFFAGYSARWMFAFNTKQAKKEVDTFLEKAPSAADLIKGIMGDQGLLAVNYLTTTTVEGFSQLVSQYVARQLAKRTELPVIEYATSHAILEDNPSFDGWVFQMDFLFHLQQAKQSTHSLGFQNTPETWLVPSIYEYYKEEEIGTLGSNLIDSIWLIPTKINPGCFDGLQLLLPQSTLRIVHLSTRDATHTLKFEYVIQVLKIFPECRDSYQNP